MYLSNYHYKAVRSSLQGGSGLLLIGPSDQIFLVKRSDTGQWGIPGGLPERDDQNLYYTALRETKEECGSVPSYKLNGSDVDGPTDYITFSGYVDQSVVDSWRPRLSDEYTNFGWFPLSEVQGLTVNPELLRALRKLHLFVRGTAKRAQSTPTIRKRPGRTLSASKSRYNHGTATRIALVNGATIVDYVRLEDGSERIELFFLKVGKEYATAFVKYFGSISTNIISKGSEKIARYAFDLFVDERTNSVEQYGQGWEVTSTTPDAEANKALRLLLDPNWGPDWDADVRHTPGRKTKYTEDTELHEQQSFYLYLEKQIDTWKGSRDQFNITGHRYWPKFRSMVEKAVEAKYGPTFTLWRGVHGNLARALLDGSPFPLRRFNSWTDSKRYAKEFVLTTPGGADLGKSKDWVVVQSSFSPKDIIFAPVTLPEFSPDPEVLNEYFKFEREFVVWGGENGSELPRDRFKVIFKTRRKRRVGTYRLARTIHDLTPEYLQRIQPEDWVRVYHASGILSGDLKPQDMVFGIDALGKQRSKYHPSGGHSYDGLYVGPTKRSVGSFGSLVFEFTVKARNLHATDWSANISKKWEKSERGPWRGDDFSYLKEKCVGEYPDSFNPFLSGALDTSAKDSCGSLVRGHEPQALFKGIAKARDILAVHYLKDVYTPQEFIEEYSKDLSHGKKDYRSKGPDPKSTTLTMDEYLNLVKRQIEPDELFSVLARYWALEGKDKALELLKGLAPFSDASANRFLQLLTADNCDVLVETWNTIRERRPDLDLGSPPNCQGRTAEAEYEDAWYHISPSRLEGPLRPIYLSNEPLGHLGKNVYQFTISPQAVWGDISRSNEEQNGQWMPVIHSSMDSIGYSENEIRKLANAGFDVAWNRADFNRGYPQIFIVNPDVIKMIDEPTRREHLGVVAEWPAEQLVEELDSYGTGKLYDDWSWTGKLSNNNVHVELRADDTKTDLVWLDTIKALSRREGYGSEALNLITKLADRNGVKIRLYIDSYGPLKDSDLRKWYSKFGFKTMRGKHMSRNPR